MMVQTYLRRGQRSLERMMLDPRTRNLAAGAACGVGGFLLSAAGIGNSPQPVALGLLCAATGWRAVLLALGAMLGYPVFWGQSGLPGIVWTAAGGLLVLLVGRLESSRDQPLMIPVIAAFLTAVTELTFCLLLKDKTPLVLRAVRVAVTGLSAVLFTQASRCRDPVTDWLAGGVLTLALATVTLGPLGLGYALSGILAVTGAFPAAALAGLGLDLARITQVPMAGVMSLAYFIRMIPFRQRWQHYMAPAAAFLVVSGACGIWDPAPLPGLVLGGALGAVLPPQPGFTRRRGETGAAQVRLEMGAEVMATLGQLLSELEPPPIAEAALLEKAVDRACGRCPARRGCKARQTMTTSLLADPLDADCSRQTRLIPELVRAREQLRLLKADRKRREEYRRALMGQYAVLGIFLRNLADRLPRKAEHPEAAFRIEVGARSRGKESANGDSCTAFPGMACTYYILLCDGMGTGLGASQEGHRAQQLLRQLLTTGFPAEQSLQTVNDLLALRGSAGAVTLDLARIHLDTGLAELFKWGAAPSYVLTRNGTEKIGTASAPPGISVTGSPQVEKKLSLRRGEVLIMLSDGLDGEGFQDRKDLSPDMPPGELAAKILERGGGGGEDDETAISIRLRPTGLAPS